MKKIAFLFLIILITVICVAQQNEFGNNKNGLMYDDSTMKQLKFVVDTLNIKFRNCELNKIFYSKYQAKAHYVNLDTGDIKKAKEDIEAGISFDDFISKYPYCKVDKELLVVKYMYNYNDKELVEFSSIPLNGTYSHKLSFEEVPGLNEQSLKNNWQFEYNKKDSYSDESIRGFYFVTDFKKEALPEIYARMVQYSECMVDTNTQIFLENARRSGVRYETKTGKKLKAFFKYINEKTNKPKDRKRTGDKYWKDYERWYTEKFAIIEEKLVNTDSFKILIKEAVNEAIKKGGAGDEFEEYVSRYYSKEAALKLKRSRKVIGGCSMDQSPRYHARDIAILSAETVNWEVFLRAHLNIMNDRFDRVSDGSYAWAQRQTYIKELEELDINVSDLLFGITLRVENPSQNHYYGSVNRLGRALAETQYADEIENKMFAIIGDNNLDDYNRILVYYLFLNYNYNLKDQKRVEKNINKLNEIINSLPVYLSSKIKNEEK